MAASEESNRDTPHPPGYPPRVDEQLEMDLMDSERRVMLYEKEVEMIREQLELKEVELLEEQNLFRDEKKTLMGKIAEFTSVLARRDEELAVAMETQDQVNEVLNLEKKAELEKKLQSLQNDLTEKTDSLEFEKRSSEELRRRFDAAQDALEFEQMNFEKERNALQELVNEERRNLKEIGRAHV